MKAMLVDMTRCIGCRGCQIACKEWNQLGAEDTTFLPAQKDEAAVFARSGYQNPRDLSSKTWTLITYNEVETAGRFHWVFGKLQCMHCGTSTRREEMPACAVSCPVKALEKTPEGPVVYHENRCIGCRYCMLACPFQVPRFEWDKALPLIKKCTMCAGRVALGQEPACCKACPTDALVFGERNELVAEAWHRIRAQPRTYVQHVYGEHELGGTCVLHLSSVPFEKLQYPVNLPEEALANNTASAMGVIPYVVAGLLAGLGATYAIRRSEVAKARAKKEEQAGREAS